MSYGTRIFVPSQKEAGGMVDFQKIPSSRCHAFLLLELDQAKNRATQFSLSKLDRVQKRLSDLVCDELPFTHLYPADETLLPSRYTIANTIIEELSSLDSPA